MSIILAIKYEDIAYLGFDSRSTSTSTYFSLNVYKDGKVFNRFTTSDLSKKYITFGVVGEHQLNNKLKHVELPNAALLEKKFPAIHKELGLKDVFTVYDNLIYRWWHTGQYNTTEFDAIGSGSKYALAAYRALETLEFTDRVRKALNITAEFDSHCGAPFYLMNCDTKNLIEL